METVSGLLFPTAEGALRFDKKSDSVYSETRTAQAAPLTA